LVLVQITFVKNTELTLVKNVWNVPTFYDDTLVVCCLFRCFDSYRFFQNDFSFTLIKTVGSNPGNLKVLSLLHIHGGPKVGENCLSAWLVKSDWCPHPSQLLRRDEGEQVMQIGLETACWHLTSRTVIKNTLWQRQHLVVHLMHQPNSSVVQH